MQIRERSTSFGEADSDLVGQTALFVLSQRFNGIPYALREAHEDAQMTSSLLRLPEVKRLSGLSRSTIYRLEAQGDFPARVRISERATAWRADEVLAWLSERPRVLRAANHPRAASAA